MTQSTRLLFRMLRTPIFFGVTLSFVVFFLISLVNPQPGYRTVISSVALTMIGTLLMNLHGWLTRLPVPVTDRQLAWIPMSIWAAFTLCAIFGIALGQLLGVLGWPEYDPDDLLSFWRTLPSVLVVTSFIAFVVWRLGRLSSAAGFPMMYILLMKSSEGGTTGWWLDWLYPFWPVWLAGSFVIIWEAPYIASLSRRIDGRTAADYGNDLFSKTDSGPVRHYWQTRAVSALIVFVLVSILIAEGVQYREQIKRNLSEHPALFALLGFIGFSLHTMWRGIRANGFAGSQAVLRLLLMSSIIGYFYRDLAGVKPGKVVKCGTCNQPKLVWQSKCPHCREENAVATRSDYTPWYNAQVNVRHDPLGFAFRVIFPIWLLFSILVVNGREWFGI